MSESSSDVEARISRLFVHPVKSCAGVEVRQAVLTPAGLDLDRAWMVVDEDGEFISQREMPRMALIRPQIRLSDVVLRAPGMLALHLQTDAAESPLQVRVWDDVVPAWDMGAVAAQWFSDFLGARVRLARFDPEHERLSDMKWTGGVAAPNQFSDGYPLLVTGQAALDGLNDRLRTVGGVPVGIERFRPNIVLEGLAAHDEDHVAELSIETAQGPVRLKLVKPCPRCGIPNVDPATAEVNTQVSEVLATYRGHPRVGGAVAFGMNAVVLEGADAELAVGQAVRCRYGFD